MLAEGVYKRTDQWAPRNSPFQRCQIAKSLCGKGKFCLWWLALTEPGKPFHPNNHLSLTAGFSPGSLKHHPHRQPRTSLLVPEIRRLQARLTGVEIWLRKSEVTSRSVWEERGNGRKTLQSNDIWVTFTGLFREPTKRAWLAAIEQWSLQSLWWADKPHSPTAWEHHCRIRGTRELPWKLKSPCVSGKKGSSRGLVFYHLHHPTTIITITIIIVTTLILTFLIIIHIVL